MTGDVTTKARALRHAEIFEQALGRTMARWSRNRSRDEIQDAVSDCYLRELARVTRKGEDLDEHAAYSISRRAVHLLTGRCAGRSRRVLSSATPAMRQAGGRHDHMAPLDPGAWIEQTMQASSASSDALETTIVEHVDLQVRIERLLAGSDHANTAADAFAILLGLGFTPAEIAACLDNNGAPLSRQATNLWKHSGRVPHAYQEQLIALVEEPEPLYEQRDLAEQAMLRGVAYTAPGAVAPAGNGVAATVSQTPRHGARGSRGAVIAAGSSRPRT